MIRLASRRLLLALAIFVCASAGAQAQTAQNAAAANSSEPIPEEQARAALSKAEAEHPGNTAEVAEAIEAVVAAQRDKGTCDDATLALMDRDVAIRETLDGKQSKAYAAALEIKSDVLIGLNRKPEARALAEGALEIAQKNFPGSQDSAEAAGTLGRICSSLGDFSCAAHAYSVAADMLRRSKGEENDELMAVLNNLGALRSRMGDAPGAIAAQEQALAIAYKLHPGDNHMGVIENNLGANYLKVQNFTQAAAHLNRAITMLSAVYGADSPRLMQIHRNLAKLYTRTGRFPEAWKAFEFSLKNTYEPADGRAENHALFAASLAQGGAVARSVDEALLSARISRELFVLEARVLPERQALAYDAVQPHALDTAISVLLAHPELPSDITYQEVVRSRAMVADEMARRQKNLNASNDPAVADLLTQLDHARADLLAAEKLSTNVKKNADVVAAATQKMEGIERSLAERSAALRSDERVAQATVDDLRRSLPAHSVLVSYVLYQKRAVDHLDPAATNTPSYMAFVLHPDSGRIARFDLGAAASLDASVRRARAAADAEERGNGLASARNERSYRAAALAIRRRAWDPLQAELGDARIALVVADGSLNLIPFAALPEGKGYLVERPLVVHMLSSERDLVPIEQRAHKEGLLAIGSPTFELANERLPPSPLRGGEAPCEDLSRLAFGPLPATAVEIADVHSAWQRWNNAEPARLALHDDATLTRFLEEAPHNRVLHVATHAFLLERGCGDNPLLHSGLVFAGGAHGAAQSILTAQQIASLDLDGVDWAVLSACNTGNGELRDGEGVLGLERAFRVAGAQSVIMTLWPIDDEAARRFMHALYTQRLQLHASTADAAWNASRQRLLSRRAAGQSTHPWYWAGFVASGSWK